MLRPRLLEVTPCNGRASPPHCTTKRWCPGRWTFSAFALRAIVLLGLMLFTFGRESRPERSMLGSGRRAASESIYVVLVGIPLLEHILPLRALARELLSRGHRVAVALPEGWNDLFAESSKWDKVPGRIKYIAAGKAMPAPEYNDSVMTGGSRAERMGGWPSRSELLALMQWGTQVEASMYSELRQALSSDRPDLVVTDRYAFAGIDVCHELSLPYAVNNPTLLLDLDQPPAYMTPPYSGLTLGRESVWQRWLHCLYRAAFQITLLQAFRDLNAFRTSVGLRAIHGRRDLYGGRLVLTNTVFGIEAPRPLRPLHRLVGPLGEEEGEEKDGEGVTMQAGLQSIKPGGKDVASWLDGLAKSGRGPQEPVLLVYLSENTQLSGAAARVFAERLSQVGTPAVWLLPPSLSPDSLGPLPPTLLLLPSASWSLTLLLALLRHRRVASVVTSCGLSIAQEALKHGKGLLCLPGGLDQREAALRLRSLGLATVCALESIFKDNDKKKKHSCFTEGLQALQLRGNKTTARQAWARELLTSSTGGGVSGAVDLLMHNLEVGSINLIPRIDGPMPWGHYLKLDVLLVYSLLLAFLVTLRLVWGLLLLLCTRPPARRVSLATRNALAMTDLGHDRLTAPNGTTTDPLLCQQHKLTSGDHTAQLPPTMPPSTGTSTPSLVSEPTGHRKQAAVTEDG